MSNQRKIRRLVLDNGERIELVDWLGDDFTPANRARVSKMSFDYSNPERNINLLREMITTDTTSPFEHVVFTFYLENIPNYVAEQLLRYRTASITKRSFRFTKVELAERTVNGLKEIFYFPEEILADEKLKEKVATLYLSCYDLYHELLSNGIKREVARCVLPSALRTSMFYTIDLRNLFRIFKERISHKAQKETREVVESMFKLVYEICPISLKLFTEIKGTKEMKCLLESITSGDEVCNGRDSTD